jgi:DNA-binding response OmpR family regulator
MHVPPSIPNEGAGQRAHGVLRILIVEDHADTAASMALLLQLYGFEITVAADGPAALERARTAAFDVALLDIALPGPLNGWELAQRLREEASLAKPFLIAISGFGHQEDQCRSAAAGIDLHLVKPVEPEALLAVLKKIQPRAQDPQPSQTSCLLVPVAATAATANAPVPGQHEQV